MKKLFLGSCIIALSIITFGQTNERVKKQTKTQAQTRSRLHQKVGTCETTQTSKQIRTKTQKQSRVQQDAITKQKTGNAVMRQQKNKQDASGYKGL